MAKPTPADPSNGRMTINSSGADFEPGTTSGLPVRTKPLARRTLPRR